ncbi:TPA: hypothetical protein DIC20_05090 [Candidatus Dependentiae bacterium]|nr:hypothetical protein [Candidatus Dependentiae bacterium]HCU01046.1 hypothetical protein [Candidatus Dependentiae bacterium]
MNNLIRPDASSTLSTKGCARPDASSTLSTKGCARPELVEGYEQKNYLIIGLLFNVFNTDF